MPMAERKGGRAARWASIAAVALLALVYAANLSVYGGSSLSDHHSWRMEQGRVTLRHSHVVKDQSFYLARNAEGLRFGFEVELLNKEYWNVTVPLWAPLLLSVGWVAWAWQPNRKARAS